MSPLSTRRTFKILGILLAVIGILVVVYAIFFLQSLQYKFQAGSESATTIITGETPFQKFVVGFVGALMIFLGYKSYEYIPLAEREKEQISELELDN